MGLYKLGMAFFGLITITALGACQENTPAPMEEAKLEYIAHASFRIVDRDGTSIVTDPFNSRIWLGYAYPKDLDADAVFISHPHFDHDASYYFDQGVQIYRTAQETHIGDIVATGVETEHMGAEEMRKQGQNASNIAWVFSVDGRKILHLGDTRPLTNDEIAAIRPVDVIMTNPEDIGTIKRLKEALSAKTVMLMHYAIPELSSDGNGLDSLDLWADDQILVMQLPSDNLSLSKLPEGFVSLKPHSGVTSWSPSMIEAGALFRSAIAASRETPPDFDVAETLLNEAIKLDPGNISPYLFLAQILERGGQSQQMAETIETGLKHATDLDWATAYRIHTKLRDHYIAAEDTERAATHLQWIESAPQAYKN